jgi:predicted small integral membrane protein
MFTSNPFAALPAFITPAMMQTYIVVMIMLVAVGTIYDVLHKKSARYFRENMRKSKAIATKKVGGGEMISMAIKTAVVDVAASGEFCNPRRRIAHLLTMYGFVAFAVTTAIMVFQYPTAATPTPAILPQLWYLGALMVCLGGYWFWFFIRVDVAAEGSSPFRVMRADLFILSLLGSATMALVWAYLQAAGNAWANAAFWAHIIATTVLFGSVPWSKFAHMFFKPAAAFEKRVSAANGSRSNLPAPADKPETLGSVHHHPGHY